MWKLCAILVLSTLAACSTGRAVRVRCAKHLVPINPPVVRYHGGPPSAKRPVALGENP